MEPDSEKIRTACDAMINREKDEFKDSYEMPILKIDLYHIITSNPTGLWFAALTVIENIHLIKLKNELESLSRCNV